ncbi:transposase [Streptomyces roseus]
MVWRLGVVSAGFVGVAAGLVPDELWERVVPLLPERPAGRFRYAGRLPVDDRAALGAIVYVWCKSVSWRDVPAGSAAVV